MHDEDDDWGEIDHAAVAVAADPMTDDDLLAEKAGKNLIHRERATHQLIAEQERLEMIHGKSIARIEQDTAHHRQACDMSPFRLIVQAAYNNEPVKISDLVLLLDHWICIVRAEYWADHEKANAILNEMASQALAFYINSLKLYVCNNSGLLWMHSDWVHSLGLFRTDMEQLANNWLEMEARLVACEFVPHLRCQFLAWISRQATTLICEMIPRHECVLKYLIARVRSNDEHGLDELLIKMLLPWTPLCKDVIGVVVWYCPGKDVFM